MRIWNFGGLFFIKKKSYFGCEGCYNQWHYYSRCKTYRVIDAFQNAHVVWSDIQQNYSKSGDMGCFSKGNASDDER